MKEVFVNEDWAIGDYGRCFFLYHRDCLPSREARLGPPLVYGDTECTACGKEVPEDIYLLYTDLGTDQAELIVF